jgi:Holliday junction resolvasome RuvABC endonuclease subunit
LELLYSTIIVSDVNCQKTRVINTHRHITSLVRKHHPTHVAIERPKLIADENTETMHWLVGALYLLETLRIQGGVSPLVEQYESLDVAKSLAGDKFGKDGVRCAVEKLLGCKFASSISRSGRAGGHDSDAAAVAIYHLRRERM